jgi:hypothetical protein
MQKGSVFMSSNTALKAPQKMMPAAKPASTRMSRLNTVLGRRSTFHMSRANANARRANDGGEASVTVTAAPRARRG